MEKTIRNRLLSMREPKDPYRNFSKSLIPGVQEMIGIRLPELRKLAKELALSDWSSVRRQFKKCANKLLQNTLFS